MPLLALRSELGGHRIGQDSQRLQTIDARPRRNRASHEGKHCRTRRRKTRHPADGARDQLWRQDVARVIHDYGKDGTEEEADEGYGDGVTNERSDLPDDEL